MGQGFPAQRLGVNISAGTQLAQSGTVVFSNSNGVSFGMDTGANGSLVVTASNGNTIAISAGTQSVATGTVSFANANGFSFGISGSSVLTVSSGFTYPDFENMSYQRGLINITHLTALSERPFFTPFYLPYYLTAQRLVFEASQSSTASLSFSLTAGLYTIVNSTQMSLLGSFSNSYSASNTSNISGIRQFFVTGFPVGATALTPGMYVLGLHFHTLGGTASLNYSIRGASTNSPLGIIGAGGDNVSTATSQVSSVGLQFMGQYSVTTAALPNAIADSDLWHGLSGSQMQIPLWFRIARTA